MGDWDSIFGAGTSAESVIAGINASWDSECRELERAQERNEREACTAFRNTPELQQDFLAAIRSRSDGITAETWASGVLSSNYPNARDFSHLADAYRVPVEILYLIDFVSGGIACAHGITDLEQWLKRAVEWTLAAIASIQPGSYLDNFHVLFCERIVEQVSQVGLGNCTSDLAYKLLRARARGVLLPEVIVRTARKEALKSTDRNLVDGYMPSGGEFEVHDLADAACNLAVQLDLEKTCTAAGLAVLARWEIRELGDAVKNSYWLLLGEQLAAVLAISPLEPSEEINLSQLQLKA